MATPEFDPDYEKRLRAIWKLLDETKDPKLQEKIASKLTEKEVIDLRKLKNPLRKPVLDSGLPRYLLFSYINLPERYQKNFTMTSLIAFLYRMLDEYVPPHLETLTSEDDPEFCRPLNELVQQYKERRPLELLEGEIASATARLEEIERLLKGETPAKDVESKKGEENGTPAKKVESKKGEKEADDNAQDAAQDETTIPESPPDPAALRVEAAKLLKSRLIAQAKLVNMRRLRAKVRHTKLKDTHQERTLELQAQESGLELARAAHALAKERLEQRLLLEKMDEPARVAHFKERLPAVLGKKDQKIYQTAKGHVGAIDVKDRPRIEGKLRRVLNLTTDLKATKEHYEADLRGASAQITRQESIVARLTKEVAEMAEELERLKAQLAELRAEQDGLLTKYNHHSKYTGPRKTHPLRKVVADEAPEPDEASYTAMVQQVKERLGLAQTREEAADAYRDDVAGFLDAYLRYNPDNHVVCAYRPNYAAEGPLPAEEAERLRVAKTAEYERILIPPADTFARWRRYEENHYEEIRQATDDIYAERADLEMAIVPYYEFEARDDADAKKQAKEWERKHAGEFEASVLSARFYRWNFLASFEKNREARDFYSEKTEVIKRILDAHQEDEKMGVKLMKDRAEKAKSKNEAVAGPVAPGFNAARRALGQTGVLERHGAQPVGEILPEQIPRDAGESKKDEVEVHGTIVQPRRIGRRRLRGATEQIKFHVPAEELPEGAVQVKRVGEEAKKEDA